MELLIALATIALGGFVVVAAKDFPTLGGYPGPGLFPQILGALLIASGVSLSAQLVRKRAWPRPSLALLGRRDVWNALIMLGSVVLYLDAVKVWGFLLTATLIVGGTMLLLGVRWWVSLLLGIAVSAATFLLFHRLLFVPLPYGPLEELLRPLLFPKV